MKIPETSANVGAYYGNEENGQWQPNGMIIDSGVGGGIVGSGDAGIHRPPVYPVHMPRPHIPGYVVAGAYYPGAYPGGAGGAGGGAAPDDFADYMWMENEEEFDKQVMQQLEEEALMEQCIEAMLEDEQRERCRPTSNGHNHHYPTTSNGNPSLSLEETVSRSTLNPLAAEFVPTRARQPPPQPHTEEKQESPPEVTATPEQKTEEPAESTSADSRVEPSPEDSQPEITEAPTSQPEPPEVSAADVHQDKPRPRDMKKDTKKQPPKTQEAKKLKPAVVKSDTKVQAKKKDVKSVKSEVKVDEKTEDATPVDSVKPQPPSPVEEAPQIGPKPINYAAAAKANKPKKPTSPPVEKTPAPAPLKQEKTKTKSEKPLAKTEKPIQRKNSAK